MKKYGQVIAKLRKQNGFTQEQLGKILNVSSQAISKWENNQSEPDLATIEKITEIFNIKISDFFDMANSEENPSSYNCEQETIILESPQKFGYDFNGWYETSNFSSQPITEIQANSYKSYVLYAKFDIIKYQLDYVMNGGTNNELNPSSFTINDFDIYLLTPTKANHTFVGWFSDPEYTQEITMISTDITAIVFYMNIHMQRLYIIHQMTQLTKRFGHMFQKIGILQYGKCHYRKTQL